MKKVSVQPIVLCGGNGTRLWPLSRAGFPKQFLTIEGKESLFQQTLKRLELINADTGVIAEPVIVTNEDHRFIAAQQLLELGTPAQILLEPTSKNTAPALTLAALSALHSSVDPVLLVLPSDHQIQDEDSFCRAIEEAIQVAETGGIITIGVEPERADTGYGYLRLGKELDGYCAHELLEFVEKPNCEDAQRYCDSAEYAWNAGVFLMRASEWIGAIKLLAPDIHDAVKAGWESRNADGDFIRPGYEFGRCRAESIDYAVMEKCISQGINISAVKVNAGWSDLGTWERIWAISGHEGENVLEGDVVEDSCEGCYVNSTGRLVAVVGVKNLAVIETDDAVLVANIVDAEGVKRVVETLKNNQRREQETHSKVHRPWGWYCRIDEGEGFQVKRIVVNPKAGLSLQKHLYRAEHWIVVRGQAQVTRGEEEFMLEENQSTYIPVGQIHRLFNPGDSVLEMIEVQSGSYLGEDDIERFEDDYGR